MKVSLIIIGVIILLIGVVSFFDAILIYQFPTQMVASNLLLRDYTLGGTVFVAIGGILIWLGVK